MAPSLIIILCDATVNKHTLCLKLNSHRIQKLSKKFVIRHVNNNNNNNNNRVKSVTNEPRSHEFLIQRVAVAIQRGNAASVLGATVAG